MGDYYPKVELGFARIHRIVNLTDRMEWQR
jgi:hypothetical protein